ncbi:MAG TPA: ribulokinase [Candidatus Hydrogenedentes bacterium]|nr:ribulokinase [Candidatus Hydrogenedentota bacterium]
MAGKYTIGLDYGTNSVRALIVNVETGEEVGTHVFDYPHGEAGIILDTKDPNLARQHPADYIEGAVASVRGALKDAAGKDGFTPEAVAGIGVDTTGSTPLPVDENGEPLASREEFKNEPAAMAWLWKDHTSHEEAAEITMLAKQMRENYLAKCGGTYSSEWFWSKLLHCKRTAPKVFDAAYTWVECADWIPGVLTGTSKPNEVKRCICAAGHKAMANPCWGGYPDGAFLVALDEDLGRIRKTLPSALYSVKDIAGNLTEMWAKKLGVPAGIPIAVGAFDAHLGAVGCGITPGVLTKIVGTSTCDMMVAPMSSDLPDIPGLCGIVPESILPDYFGLEAGQSAFGDIYNWFVNYMQPGGLQKGSHEALTEGAEVLQPGASGLLALDWHNGNRTVLVDPRLSGLVLGMSLHTTPSEIYRALIEATAFGARVIMERFEEYGVKVERVINCGGIAMKNPLVMQILADVFNRTMEIARSTQTCALGSAMCGAVISGAHKSFADATKAMTGIQSKKYVPNSKNVALYQRLFPLYKQLHDAFGTKTYNANLANVMKDLLALRDEVRK